VKYHFQLKQMQRATRNSQQACHTKLTSCMDWMEEYISRQQKVETMEDRLGFKRKAMACDLDDGASILTVLPGQL